MAAPIIRDQQPANAGGAHLSKGDLLAGWFGHGGRLKGASLSASAVEMPVPGNASYACAAMFFGMPVSNALSVLQTAA